MLMRTDPFRDLDRLTQQLLGTSARPSAMLMDAWREDDHFVVEFDLPGVNPDSVDLDVERNVLTVTAERPALDEDSEFLAAERPRGVFSRQLVLGDNLDLDNDPGRLPRRGAATGHPGRRAGQAPQDQHQPQRRRDQAITTGNGHNGAQHRGQHRGRRPEGQRLTPVTRTVGAHPNPAQRLTARGAARHPDHGPGAGTAVPAPRPPGLLGGPTPPRGSVA